MPKKSPMLVSVTIGVWLLLSVVSLPTFLAAIPLHYHPAVRAALLGFYGWYVLFWLLGLHNFLHYICAHFRSLTRPAVGNAQLDVPVAIIYTTCDDFDPVACASALQQTHPLTRLIIADDSFDPANRRAIDQWARQQNERVEVIRRPDNKGFKAGNLNNVLGSHVFDEYVLICDADEVIPPDFVERLLPYFTDDSIGFVQASHRARLGSGTRFGATQTLGVDIYFGYFLPSKNRIGFVSFAGHGAIIRRSVWEQTGGFPHIIVEDLGFASRARSLGYRGVFVPDVIAHEATPQTYKALLKSRTRLIKGAIEYFQQEYSALLKSPKVTLTEKLDVLLTTSSCYLNVIMVVNLWGGLILSHLHWLQGVHQVSSWEPFAYVLGPVLAVTPILVDILRHPARYGQYLFAMAAIHASLMPMLALGAIEQTLHLRAPIFHVTGKIARQPQSLRDYALSIPFGLALAGGAWLLPSQVTPLMFGLSLTFLLTPMMAFTEKNGLLGVLGRQWGLAPYLAMMVLGVWVR